jgi:hypothetical protein
MNLDRGCEDNDHHAQMSAHYHRRILFHDILNRTRFDCTMEELAMEEAGANIPPVKVYPDKFKDQGSASWLSSSDSRLSSGQRRGIPFSLRPT